MEHKFDLANGARHEDGSINHLIGLIDDLAEIESKDNRISVIICSKETFDNLIKQCTSAYHNIDLSSHTLWGAKLYHIKGIPTTVVYFLYGRQGSDETIEEFCDRHNLKAEDAISL